MMKSLILKDLYNIGHNTKSMLFILIIFAVAIIPFSGVSSYIFICSILCSMMIVTTFSFDDNSNWIRYALILPISKKNIVLAKFVTLFIFSACGALTGLVIGTVGGRITKIIDFSLSTLCELLFLTLAALVIAMIFGGISIPLVYKFGAEKGRMLLLVSFLLPIGLCWVIYQLSGALGIELTEKSIFVLLCCFPIIALLWDYVMYRISYKIFYNKDNN